MKHIVQRGLPLITYVFLHAIWTPSPPPFLHVNYCNTQWKCIGGFAPPPPPLGAYVVNGRPQASGKSSRSCNHLPPPPDTHTHKYEN